MIGVHRLPAWLKLVLACIVCLGVVTAVVLLVKRIF
jgi:hypothetical protein